MLLIREIVKNILPKHNWIGILVDTFECIFETQETDINSLECVLFYASVLEHPNKANVCLIYWKKIVKFIRENLLFDLERSWISLSNYLHHRSGICHESEMSRCHANCYTRTRWHSSANLPLPIVILPSNIKGISIQNECISNFSWSRDSPILISFLIK